MKRIASIIVFTTLAITSMGCYSEVKCMDFIPNRNPQNNLFLDTLSYTESRGDYTIVNQFGYMGKYQIGVLALRDIGFLDKNEKGFVDKFKKNPNHFPAKLQDSLVKEIVKKHYYYLRSIKSSIGDTIKGRKITLSGLMAASFLVGSGKVRLWIKSNGNIIPKDGNGVKCTTYFDKFSSPEMDEAVIQILTN